MVGTKGHLLYATCSILPEENEAIIAKFLAHHDADEIKLSVGVEAHPWHRHTAQ